MKNLHMGFLSKILKLVIIILLTVFTLFAGFLGVSIVGVLEKTPSIDVSKVDSALAQTSEIVDADGNKIETIQTKFFRELISYEEIPENLINAFISIEDVRFYKHNGVDPIGIVASLVDNLRYSSMRGASTLAQQLARNRYLNEDKRFAGHDKRLEKKMSEAYLAIQLTESLGREGILKNYMNTVFLGQNAYGVQAASKTYFSKDVKDLTLAECAAIASIVQSPNDYSLYKTMLDESIMDDDIVLGEIEINGVDYKAVYNDAVIDRQKRTLENMLKEKYITKEQYDEALKENISEAIVPGQNSTKQEISSYFSDLTAEQVIEKLQTELNYSEEDAKAKYYNGGIKVYASIDKEMQEGIQDVFENFSSIVLGNSGSQSSPALLGWAYDGYGNITNSKQEVVYYKKANLLTEDGDIYLYSDEYELNDDGSLTIKSKKFPSFFDPKDYYTVNEQNNLVTHIITGSGRAEVEKDDITSKDSNLILSKNFLDKYEDLYTIADDGTLILDKGYFSIDLEGTPQPQGSIVVIDHKNGEIKAVVGGRTQKGRMIMNRATNVPRQPGSSIKPIAAYTPALDNGYTVATPIDDVPFEYEGKMWPKNVYNGFRGLVSLRESVRDSINVNAVKVVEDLGTEKIKTYLEKFGIIDSNNIDNDDFVSASEDPMVNDETLASLALGGMTHGVTNLDISGAYAALANGGEYIEPLTFTKVEDYDGSILLEDVNKKNTVVSPQVAYVMTDVLKDVLTVPYGNIAFNPNYDIAGKTGTTEENQDVWFVGYSPYYTIGSWVGFDNQQLKLSQNGGQALYLWSASNKVALKDLPSKRFEEPDGIVRETVCTIGDAKPTAACYNDHRGLVKTELFVKGTEPTTYCKVHTYGALNRPIPYDPSRFNIYPDDWNISSSKTKKDKDKDDEKDDNNNNNDNGDNNNNNQNIQSPTPSPNPSPSPTPAPAPTPTPTPPSNNNENNNSITPPVVDAGDD